LLNIAYITPILRLYKKFICAVVHVSQLLIKTVEYWTTVANKTKKKLKTYFTFHITRVCFQRVFDSAIFLS